jgi:hypothetical protein
MEEILQSSLQSHQSTAEFPAPQILVRTVIVSVINNSCLLERSVQLDAFPRFAKHPRFPIVNSNYLLETASLSHDLHPFAKSLNFPINSSNRSLDATVFSYDFHPLLKSTISSFNKTIDVGAARWKIFTGGKIYDFPYQQQQPLVGKFFTGGKIYDFPNQQQQQLVGIF